MRTIFVILLAGSVFCLSAEAPRSSSPVRMSGKQLESATPATPKEAPEVQKPTPVSTRGPAVTAPDPATKNVRSQALTGHVSQAPEPRHQALTGHDPSRVDPYRQAQGGTVPRPVTGPGTIHGSGAVHGPARGHFGGRR